MSIFDSEYQTKGEIKWEAHCLRVREERLNSPDHYREHAPSKPLSRMAEDSIMAFETGPPYHDKAVLCLDCGSPGFDRNIPYSEVGQDECDKCGRDLEDTYESIARRSPPLRQDDYVLNVLSSYDAEGRRSYPWIRNDDPPEPRME